MHRRINITLSEETVDLVDRIVKKGDRSRFIDEAIRQHVRELGRKKLRRRLKEGALKRAKRDVKLSDEWFVLEEEAWQKNES
jgi:CopG family transcriptional regulator / antitoxin EndoAI